MTPEETLDWLAKQHFDQCLEERPIQDWIRKMKSQLPEQPAVAEQHKQGPLEYWNAVEGWVKIDEVREHFDSVGCGTIYKTSGEGRVPLSLCKAQPEQEPVACVGGDENGRSLLWESSQDAFDIPVGTKLFLERFQQNLDRGRADKPCQTCEALARTVMLDQSSTDAPQRKPLTDEQIYDMYNEPRSDAEMLEFARAIEAAHGIRPTDFKEKNNGS